MRRSKMLMATTALALSLTLSSCGGGEEEQPAETPSEPTSESAATPSPTESQAAAADSEYCQQLETSQDQFGSIARGDVGQFDEAVAELRDLRKTAPPEIKPAWDDLLAPVDQLETGLNEAGLKLSDLEGLSRGEVPRGVNPRRLQKVAADLQGLNSAEVNEAATEIERYAVEECGITLAQ